MKHVHRLAGLLLAIASAVCAGEARAGKVKLLAVQTPRRSRLFPDVPTFAEAGLDGFTERPWWGLFAPVGTADAMTRRIYTEFVRLFQDSKFLEYLENQFIEPMDTKPEEFAAFLKEERYRAGQLVRKYNIPRQ